MANRYNLPFGLDLRYRLEYAGLRFLIGIVRAFPLDTACDISAFFWRMLGKRNRRHKRALANLERAFPEKSPEERERIAIASWDNLGRVMVETMNIDRILKDPGRLHVTRVLVAVPPLGRVVARDQRRKARRAPPRHDRDLDLAAVERPQLAAFALGPVGPDLLNTAGFLCVALYLAGIGAGSYGRARTRRR